jgi:hypothetical protein
MLYEKSSEVNQSFWDRLCSMQPKAVCYGSGATVIARSGQVHYRIRMLDRTYDVDPINRTISQVLSDGSFSEEDIGFDVALVILSHLVSSKQTPQSGRWVSEKDLKGGAMFFRGVHALPLGLMLERFGRDAQAFCSACLLLGGRPEPFGDASYSLQVLPGIPVVFILWEADDEFPARVSVLFDESIEQRFPLDVILALVKLTAARLLEAADKPCRPARA